MVRTVVITGGGTGIGRACAAHFAAEGNKVIITGRRKEVLEESAASLGVEAVAFDASDPFAVAAALEKLPTSVDVLINNAGGNTDLSHAALSTAISAPEPQGRLEEIASRWQANFEANVLSAVLVTEALAARLTDNARIITIGSIAGRTGGGGSYGAAKAAIEAWTADLARSLGSRGITANVVAPGLIESTEFFQGRLADERRARLVEATFTKRAGQPKDVVAAVAFLALPSAGHVTGQVIPVNGGAHLAR
ncbi:MULTISPECIES: SDR family NAD(P)-dependent oxidoreductase [Rhizobium/Agrobacterium group]|uniref:3-oxoacyl-[acyl-carrier-protein] reductase FabG n=3 Tax=Rhizobium/Agrobacterium group TaxID=227290 RepID=A0A5B9T8W3_AGRTU|nr:MULTISPECIES: SDR family oxidoreductase [Rhizobium/Agrobacterium group]ACM30936.1 short chain dehydrogenase protein [Rhizobium rhizogenes K84]QEG97851.1 3-oxoacyl-[acyl-carrier-protein] reductase FabG [Agrobacterium tumefaciens]UYZ11370.1 SDR family oxidoreductase [Agrobacterium salinitolerans]WHO25067.1 SDR family oxidoreductase [Agrobacterium tumefaciens]